jgi:hypothetical protein
MAVDYKITSIKIEDPSIPSADGSRRRPGIAIVELELTLPEKIFGMEPVRLTIRKEYPAIEQLSAGLREELVKLGEDIAKGCDNLHL